MDRGRLQLVLVLLGSVWHSSAWGQSVAESLGEAVKAFEEDDTREMRRQLDDAEDAILQGESVVATPHLAQYWYLRGLEHHKRRKTKRAMDAWRKALVVNPDFEWDVSLMSDKDPRRLFEALRGETGVRAEVDAQVPQKVGAATMWVDGRRVRHEARVMAGPHLLQVVCPDTKVYGQFTELPDKKLDWLSLCPAGVDTSVVVTESAADEDEFDGLAPDFDDPPLADPPAAKDDEEASAAVAESVKEPVAEPSSDDEDSPVASDKAEPKGSTEDAPTKDAESDATDDGASAQAAASSSAAESPTKPSEPSPKATDTASSPKGESILSRLTPKTYAVAAGGGLVVGGVIANFAVVEPVWVQIEDVRAHPTRYTRWQADWLTNRFNTYRAVSLGLMGSGVVVAGAGYFLLDGSVKPVIHARGAGITGQF